MKSKFKVGYTILGRSTFTLLFVVSYNRGAIPGSINIPYSTAFSTQDGSLLPSSETNSLNANRGKIIAVVGNRGDSAVKVRVVDLYTLI